MRFLFVLAFLVVGSVAVAESDSASVEAEVLRKAVADFDRELDLAPSSRWSLEHSPAYQNLMAIRRGDTHPFSSAERFQPGTGASGHLTGSELPKNTWAITYDDGPHPTATQLILKVLKDFKVPATFFWLAENVVKNSDVVQVVEAAGHAVENHSYTHADLNKATDLALGYEVGVANQIMKDHYLVDPRFFRCPYGAGDGVARVRKVIAAQKLISVIWNVDSLDWADRNASSVAERVRKQMVKLGHGIVLFHDIQPHTASASQKVFSAFKNSKLRFVTLPQIVNELNASH